MKILPPLSGRHSARATPSLRDDQTTAKETGGHSTYPTPIPVQTNPATSDIPHAVGRPTPSAPSAPFTGACLFAQGQPPRRVARARAGTGEAHRMKERRKSRPLQQRSRRLPTIEGNRRGILRAFQRREPSQSCRCSRVGAFTYGLPHQVSSRLVQRYHVQLHRLPAVGDGLH
jgi:hypothetical protein